MTEFSVSTLSEPVVNPVIKALSFLSRTKTNSQSATGATPGRSTLLSITVTSQSRENGDKQANI